MVLLEPVPNGAIGAACLSGVCAVQVDLTATWHFRADLVEDDPAYLRSYPGGSAEILAIDRTGTGTKWAYVRLGVSPEVEYIGTLDGVLNSGSSATMSLYQLGGSGWADTTWNETVYAPWILASGSIPATKRIAARWHGQAFRLQAFDWEDRPATTEITVMTNFNVDTDNMKLQKKTRTAKVLDPGTESGWTDIHTGAACP